MATKRRSTSPTRTGRGAGPGDDGDAEAGEADAEAAAVAAAVAAAGAILVLSKKVTDESVNHQHEVVGSSPRMAVATNDLMAASKACRDLA